MATGLTITRDPRADDMRPPFGPVEMQDAVMPWRTARFESTAICNLCPYQGTSFCKHPATEPEKGFCERFPHMSAADAELLMTADFLEDHDPDHQDHFSLVKAMQEDPQVYGHMGNIGLELVEA